MWTSMVRYLSVALAFAVITAAPIEYARSVAASTRAAASPSDIVQKRTIAPGERTILTVRTSGVVEVVIFEHTGEPDLLQTFRSGQVPRTAKVFTNIKKLAYPLASEAGADFYVRVRPLTVGETTVYYESGTIAQAMARLRSGNDLVRNRGTVWVRDGLHQMPVYQLVPGTMIRVEILAGRGTVALLKTQDYLAVRDGRTTLVSRCVAGSCVRSETGGTALALPLDDYDDRYLMAVPEGASLEFSYQVIATPKVLNYITTCT